MIWHSPCEIAASTRRTVAEWKLFVANEFVISASIYRRRRCRLRCDLNAYRWRKRIERRTGGLEWRERDRVSARRGGEKERNSDIMRRSARARARANDRSRSLFRSHDRARNFRPKSSTLPAWFAYATLRGFHSGASKARRDSERRVFFTFVETFYSLENKIYNWKIYKNLAFINNYK